MKGILQIMLVALIGLSISLGAQANRPTEIPKTLPMRDFSEFIIQKSLVIEDCNSKVNSRVFAPERAYRTAISNNESKHARVGEKYNTVTIRFTGDIDPIQMTPTIRFYKEGDFYLTGEIIASENWTDEKTVVLSVPSGVYDIYVYWTEFETGISNSRHCLVVKENLSIDADTDYTYDKGDAPNSVDFHFTLPNGDSPQWPGVKIDETSGNPIRDWSNANVGKTNSILHIISPKYGFEVAHNSMFNAASDGGILEKFDPSEEMRLWCSTIPSEMWITQHIIMENESGEIYSSMASTSVKEGENIVEVDNKGYCLVSEEMTHTPYFYDNDYQAESNGNYTLCEEVLGFSGFSFEHTYVEGDNIDIYILTKPWSFEDKEATLTYVTQTLYDLAKEITGSFGMTSWQFLGIKSPEIYSHNEGGYYLNSRYDDFMNHYIFSAPEGGYYKWPGILPRNNFHPVFSYDAALRKQKLGNNAPIMSVVTVDYGTPDMRIPIASPAIKGRYGESRVIDLETISASLSIGGDKLFEGSWSGLVDFMFDEYWNSPDGRVEVVLKDENVSVDGIAGKNVTEFSYEMSGEDVWAPTLQMLHFKDAEGNVNDRFVNASEGTIEFAGGDFIEHFNDENYYWYTEEEAEVNVEYAPYGTEDFAALEVNEIPELYFMPGYGHFYRGSLGSVDRKSSNGWFDIRISMKDAAGNCQIQTISPAFKVESLSGVETVRGEYDTVKIDGRNIIAPEGSKIFTIQGIMTDGKNVMPGIYLVKTAEKTSKVIVK